MFLLGMSCTLRSKEEHRRLRCPPHNPQIVVKTDPQGQDYLVYTENSKSKAHQGGLYSRVKKEKVVPIHENKLHPERDVMRLYQRYISLLPVATKSQALYKFGLSENRRMPRTWYTDKPLGVNSLKKVVKNITQSAGVKGKYSNHSLRVTTATRLFQSGVDEQVIKEMMGHKSDAVRMYKHSSTQILRDASSKIANEQATTSTESEAPPSSSWDDKDYCDTVMAKQEPEIVHIVIKPGVNRAHKRPCHTADENGNCTAFCTILDRIDKEQENRKLKKVKLSLKYRCK